MSSSILMGRIGARCRNCIVECVCEFNSLVPFSILIGRVGIRCGHCIVEVCLNLIYYAYSLCWGFDIQYDCAQQ